MALVSLEQVRLLEIDATELDLFTAGARHPNRLDYADFTRLYNTDRVASVSAVIGFSRLGDRYSAPYDRFRFHASRFQVRG